MTKNKPNPREEKIEEKVYEFEAKFGMCFQPFGDNLDEAKSFLRNALTTQEQEVRARVLEDMIEDMERQIIWLSSRKHDIANLSTKKGYSFALNEIQDYLIELKNKKPKHEYPK